MRNRLRNLRATVWLLAAAGLLGAGGPARAASPHPVPGSEPPESVIVDILRKEYEELNRRGGMKVNGTIRGQPVVLKPRIWQARKLGCRPLPQSKPGDYECSLDLKVTLLEGDNTPKQHAERVMVGWDEVNGAWTGLQALEARRMQDARAASRAERERKRP